jgi:hypothetical protein
MAELAERLPALPFEIQGGRYFWGVGFLKLCDAK